MTLHEDVSGPPCRHMEKLLNDAADGRSRGLRLWYAVSHAARCGRCGRYLASLKGMIVGLRRARDEEPDAEVMESLREKIRAAR